ncbi:MAG: hypothetical protein AB8B50_01300 [Pirellulaceae bacterium]
MPAHSTFHFHLKRMRPSSGGAGEGIPFECEFEELVARLAALPGMFVELDGSFVFRSQGANSGNSSDCAEAERWQMDGMIYDNSVPDGNGGQVGRVIWCEIRGQFSREVWEQVLACFETPVEDLVAVQLDQGVSVPISELFN